MYFKKCTVKSPEGLTNPACEYLVAEALKIAGHEKIFIRRQDDQGGCADSTSFIGILLLAAACGTVLEVFSQADELREAVNELAGIIESINFMPEKGDLFEFFSRAVKIGQENKFPKDGKIFIVDRLENFFTVRLNCQLLDSHKLEEDLFECADYIAKTLAGFVREFPSSARAAEYFYAYLQHCQGNGENNYVRREDFLARGGQTCFAICVFFPALAERRRVSEKYYAQMGATFFYQYFLEGRRPVAYSMAEHFDELVPLTREAIAN